MNQNDRAAAAKVALGKELEETIEIQSEVQPELKGSITYALPTGKELMRIAVIQHDLREGRPLEAIDPLSAGLVVVLACLSVVVRRAPDWWYRTEGTGKDARRVAAPELLTDTSLLWTIWGRYVSFRESFSRRGDDATDHPAAGGAEPALAGEATQPAAV